MLAITEFVFGDLYLDVDAAQRWSVADLFTLQEMIAEMNLAEGETVTVPRDNAKFFITRDGASYRLEAMATLSSEV